MYVYVCVKIRRGTSTTRAYRIQHKRAHSRPAAIINNNND